MENKRVENENYQYVPASLAIQAMRDSGYKNTAYAIAELMDNSIQAGATQVELLCHEREFQINQRARKRIEQIGVLDNGTGMPPQVLWIALQFGNGTRLESGKKSGIGRFGVGLPASSISQCKRVDVWSWQEGIEQAYHTYLDVDEISSGKRDVVPAPTLDTVPETWRNFGTCFGKTGTLVVWSKLDRLMWRSSNALISNSELIIGRIYRNFLDNDKISIKSICFDPDDASNCVTQTIRPNDPGYLMGSTTCPAPFDKVPMFQPWPSEDDYEITHTVNFRGENHDVKIRFSIAKQEARKEDQAGLTPYGKDAKRNVGVSLVRAGRELELDQSLVIQYDPRERWWGVEVEFPPSLDDLFGVTNNKQSARNFADVANFDIESLLTGGKTIIEAKEELVTEEDFRKPLIDIVYKISQQIRVMRGVIAAQTKGTRRQKKERYTAEEKATARTRERQKDGYAGGSDEDEGLPPDQRESEISHLLEEEGVSENVAKELAATTVTDNLKYIFADADLETDAFFSVKPRGGAIIITLNINHPAYDSLVEVLEEDTEGLEDTELAARLERARDGLKLLLSAWARYEDELPDGERRTRAQETRFDWGRVARAFLAQ